MTSIYTRTDQVVTILLVLAYLYNLGLWLLRGSLPPCFKKLENDNFTKILDATTKEFEFCKFKFQTAFLSLNAVLYVS